MKIEVKGVQPLPPPKEYVLTLNQKELDIIVSLLGNISGDFCSVVRKATDPMWWSLKSFRQEVASDFFEKITIQVKPTK